jgi:arsenate reductase
MAEAFLRHYAGEDFDVQSAGVEPAERIHPMAREVMAEVGLNLEGQEPSGMKRQLGSVATGYVIIVCGQTAEQCPKTWPGVMQRLVWPFEDPVQYDGSEEERREKFREVRDKIDERIRSWLREQAIEPSA